VPFLTKLKVKNFRSVRELELRLSPLTALVGPNGAGKSTVLSALDLNSPLEPTWRHEAVDVVIERLLERGFSSLSTRSADEPKAQHRGHFSVRVQHLRLGLDQMREAVQVNPEHSLSSDGGNLANVVATMPRATQALLAQELCARVAGISDVDLVPSGNGRHRLRFHDRWSPTVFRPEEVSDGTILMLAFLALRHQQQVPDLITIEEPERGLHPYLLGELVGFLRELTSGPKPIQVVVATHSAEFLEYLKPDEVRFLSRIDGNVVSREVDTAKPDWARFYREFDDSLGSAWLSGGLGGTPTN
jgi:predicted ATPase